MYALAGSTRTANSTATLRSEAMNAMSVAVSVGPVVCKDVHPVPLSLPGIGVTCPLAPADTASRCQLESPPRGLNTCAGPGKLLLAFNIIMIIVPLRVEGAPCAPIIPDGSQFLSFNR